MERFYQALTSLLPQGYAWPRDPNSVLMRLMRATAGAFGELQAFIEQTVAQWQPHITVNRLAEWEAATGLPDDCFGTDQTANGRRLLLLDRLRGMQLKFEDSSAAALGAIEDICLALGYPASAKYNLPFRVGMRVSDRLGALDGQLYITVTIQASPFRCGDPVGKRLLEGALNGSELICFLRRVLPARFNANYIFI
jgi:uncharacterized protein YmfQ (DUF2313 family)